MKKPKYYFVVFDLTTGEVVGHTRAVSARKAITNVWWRSDARSSAVLATEVKERRAEYAARPESRVPQRTIKRRNRRRFPNQAKLFRL